jgi:sugar-specific transcriptional regulator TrmB
VEGKKLSLEQALKTLKAFGLTETEAQIYVYLAKKGSHERKEITDALKLPKKQLSLSLKGY